jgi:hypothetical protein
VNGLPSRFTTETVKVSVLKRGGGMGGRHLEPRDVTAAVQDEQQTILDADGSEVVSNTQVHVAFDEDIPMGSLVTVWPGLPGERSGAVKRIGRFRHERLPSFQTLFLV